MTTALATVLANAADRVPGPTVAGTEIAPSITTDQLTACVEIIIEELHNSEVWQVLLHTAATSSSAALARALLPALTQPNLYAFPTTWLPASHAARRIYQDQTDENRQRIDDAVRKLLEAEPRAATSPDLTVQLQSRIELIIAALHPRPDTPANEHPALPQLGSDPLDRPQMIHWAPETPASGTPAEVESRLAAITNSLSAKDPAEVVTGAEALMTLWSELPPANTTPPTDQFATIRVDAAYQLTKLSDVTPNSPTGVAVLDTLRRALPPNDEPAAQDTDTDSVTELGGWSVTSHTQSLEGLVALASRAEWQESNGDDLRTLLTPYLDCPDTAYRLIAVRALGFLYRDPQEHLAAVASRLKTETSDHIRQFLLIELWNNRFRATQAVDQTLAELAALPAWTCLSSESDSAPRLANDFAEFAVRITAVLACQHETPFASAAVQTWLADPVSYPARGQVIATTIRDAFNVPDAALVPTERRAFAFARLAVNAALRCRAENTDGTDGAAAVAVATEIGHQLYFASGASDTHLSDPATASKRGPISRFAPQALPILDDLATIADARLAHHLIKTLDHVREVQPGRGLAIAAKTVAATPAFARDRLALTDVIELIRHAASEHQAALARPEAQLAVQALLSRFVRLGWDEAIALYDEISEIY